MNHEENSVRPTNTMSKLKHSLARNFAYTLTDKKATSNFLKSASKDPLEVDVKQRCIVFTFSVGAYARCVLPQLKRWETDRTNFRSGNLEIETLSFTPGLDKSGKHIDSVVAFSVNGKKVTVSCFNTTQRIKIEGNG